MKDGEKLHFAVVIGLLTNIGTVLQNVII